MNSCVASLLSAQLVLLLNETPNRSANPSLGAGTVVVEVGAVEVRLMAVEREVGKQKKSVSLFECSCSLLSL